MVQRASAGTFLRLNDQICRRWPALAAAILLVWAAAFVRGSQSPDPGAWFLVVAAVAALVVAIGRGCDLGAWQADVAGPCGRVSYVTGAAYSKLGSTPRPERRPISPPAPAPPPAGEPHRTVRALRDIERSRSRDPEAREWRRVQRLSPGSGQSRHPPGLDRGRFRGRIKVECGSPRRGSNGLHRQASIR